MYCVVLFLKFLLILQCSFVLIGVIFLYIMITFLFQDLNCFQWVIYYLLNETSGQRDSGS